MCCLRLSCVLARVPSLPSLYMPSVSDVARAQRGQGFGHRVDTRGQRSNPLRTRIRTCGQSRRNGGSPAPCVPDDGTSRSRRSAPASTRARVRRIAAQTKWFVEHEQLCNSTAVINTHPSAVPRCGFEVRRFGIAVAWYKYIHTHSSIRKKRQEVEVRPEFRGIRGLREQRRASADTLSITRIRRSSSWIIVPRKHTGTKKQTRQPHRHVVPAPRVCFALCC